MSRKVRTAIVGAGFGGVAAAHALLQRGQDDFVILERGDRPGGVWRANTYPGIACDVPSVVYSLSFAPNPNWTRRFSPGDEIQAYLLDVMRRFGLDEHVRVDADVVRARFEDASGRWRLELADGDVIEAEVLISACGQLTRPALPKPPGLERFEGQWFHSAHWPEGAKLDGARVAVIGTGASAIQFAPSIAPSVAHMTIFQRSAPWVIPKLDTQYGRITRWLYARFPRLQWLARRFWQVQLESLAPVFTRQPPLRARIMHAIFNKLAALQRFVQLRGNRRLIETATPDYALGCKRVLLTMNWYPTLRRPNVEVSTSPVREVVRDGVITEDGTHHEVDTIIFGTGFTATQFLAPMKVFGRHGVSIEDAWKEGAEAFLGITVPGFPNFFMLYGPNTNHGTGSAIEVIEAQARYAAQGAQLLAEDVAQQLEVRREAHEVFKEELQRRLQESVWASCTSWYVTETGRITNNWPGTFEEYRKRTRQVNLADYLTARPQRSSGLQALSQM
ncbi:MAG: NAD(P)/FAD-dependent oxidoreductase [Polyangiales bacterium]